MRPKIYFVELVSSDEDDDLRIVNDIAYENSKSRTWKLDMLYHAVPEAAPDNNSKQAGNKSWTAPWRA